jgi:cytochrome c-type biogenesis protein CcmH/NrfF
MMLTLVLATAAGAAPRASLPDIEDEVMCAECGTALSISNSPVAEEERAFIRRLIDQGRTKQEIKDALVEEYGPAILALPQEKGFNLAVYLVPGALLLLGAIAIATTARRWRRVGETVEVVPELDAEDARRLDADLARFDR